MKTKKSKVVFVVNWPPIYVVRVAQCIVILSTRRGIALSFTKGSRAHVTVTISRAYLHVMTKRKIHTLAENRTSFIQQTRIKFAWQRLAQIKVRLSLCFIFNRTPRHEGVLGEWSYSATHSLTSALNGGEWSASRFGRFTPSERAPGTHWIGGWVDPRVVLDAVVTWKILPRNTMFVQIPLSSFGNETRSHDFTFWVHFIRSVQFVLIAPQNILIWISLMAFYPRQTQWL
jgi:hypothetical protein